MKIYTKKGDFGRTSTINKHDLPKDSLVVVCIGTLDELNATIGLTISHLNETQENELVKEVLQKVQGSIFALNSHLAGLPGGIDANLIYDIEQIIDLYQSKLPELTNFIQPSGSKAATHCHHARTVCRRAERLLVAFDKEQDIDKNILRYINRLSDLLFVLARVINKNEGQEETVIKD